jgi:predicted TIM-barrel fold metal-dependent hydrolase
MDRRQFLAAGAVGAITATIGAATIGLAAMPAQGAEGAPPPGLQPETASDLDDYFPPEPAIEPALPIVDAHRHMGWTRLLPKTAAIVAKSGHNITHTVFVESHIGYRPDGPEALRPVGEVEAVNGMAAMAESGHYGRCRIAAGIVAYADVRMGDDVKRVLDAEVAAGNGRLRGVRGPLSAPPDASKLPPGAKIMYTPPGKLEQSTGRKMDTPPGYPPEGNPLEPHVREGLAALVPLGLSYDFGVRLRQMGQLAEMADAVPNLQFILAHAGSPLDLSPTEIDRLGKRAEFFKIWSDALPAVAKRPNVAVKIGNFAMDLGAPADYRPPILSSEQLAAQWRPYVERVVELFGVDRCMFEGDGAGMGTGSVCAYGTMWNAFKRITANWSAPEKHALFSGTATRVYRLVEA